MKRSLMVLLAVAALLALFQAVGPALSVSADPAAKGTPDFPIRNDIDKHILARLREEKIDASPTCSDEEFIRRAYLDLCGLIPSPGALREFVSDSNANKRSKLIDSLLKSERYADHFAVMWGDLLREHSNSRPKEGTERGSYREWIKDALKSNMPYDRFVRELITATGPAEDNGAVNFFLRDENDRVETTNNVSTVFMGTRMSCAQCHDHPFDKWTQNDFHSIMAFFGRTNLVPDPVATMLKIDNDTRLPKEIREFLEPYFAEAREADKKEKEQREKSKAKGELPTHEGETMGMAMGMQMMGMNGKARNLQKEIDEKLGKEAAQRVKNILQQNQTRQVVERNNGEYKMPADGQVDNKKRNNGGDVVPAVFPWDPTKKSEGPGSRRKALADYVTGSRQFAIVQVNRLWARVMGKGIVDPTDDFREKNPPSHPELLNYLADEFVKSKFDNHHVLKLIMNSSTYQRSSMPMGSNRSDKTFFSHARLRRMTAEQLFDSVLVATGRDNGMNSMRIDKASIQAQKGGKGYGARNEPVQWAVDLPTPARTGTFMNTFNQPTREQTTVTRDEAGSIPQALEFLNGNALNDAIRTSPRITQMIEEKLDPKTITTELYLSVLSRSPTSQEINFATTMLKSAVASREWIEDMYWALLNSREFTFVK
jgi:hypothetical protein